MGIRKGQNTWWKNNPSFVRQGVKTILEKNYGLCIDSHEIDSKLTIGENLDHLLTKFSLFINKHWRK